jgi:hypothetical protein
MKTKIVVEAGFVNGRYVKAGASVPDYENMSRDELLKAAKARGDNPAANSSKADLLALFVPPAEPAPETS